MTPVRPRDIKADAVRVMVCDDSVVMRAALARALESDPAMRVVARAADGK
jgi:two-component system, chemotaxis family, protein-glutamate methylesterase/glutaminase